MRYWWTYFVTQVLTGLIFKTCSLVSRCTFGLLFFRLEVEGNDYVRKLGGPLIVTPNHKSYSDHFFILSAIIGNNWNILPARAMAADWLFQISFVGWALKNLFGAYPVRKGEGLDVSLRDPLRVLYRGHVVVIYPEGRIQFRPGVHQVRVGAAYLAQKSGTPILPVAIQGIEYLSLKAFLFGRRKVKVIFGKPFHIDRGQDLTVASEEIRVHIAELYGQPQENIREACQLPV